MLASDAGQGPAPAICQGAKRPSEVKAFPCTFRQRAATTNKCHPQWLSRSTTTTLSLSPKPGRPMLRSDKTVGTPNPGRPEELGVKTHKGEGKGRSSSAPREPRSH